MSDAVGPRPSGPGGPGGTGGTGGPGGPVRLVATDLDGTLLQPDGTVSERTREVLDAVDDLGVLVVFVTGRPIRWVEPLRDHVGAHGLAVCSNGGVVYDVTASEVLSRRTIDRATGLAVADRVREALPGSFFSIERTSGFARENDFPVPHAADVLEQPEIGTLEEIFDDDVVKMLALHPDHPPVDYWQRVDALAGGAVTTTWSSTNALVEMSGAGVTKASTLEQVCAERGIAREEVVAFGDMPNDLQLMRWAGTSYAMANAHPSVLEAADRTAPRNDEDGVARVLTDLLLR